MNVNDLPQSFRESVPHIPSGTWISAARLAEDSVILASKIPPNVDCIVAISRSGFVPATIIASILHKPLWMVSGRYATDVIHCPSGWRIGSDNPNDEYPEPSTVVIVDDSTGCGNSLGVAINAVKRKWRNAIVKTAVVYATPSMVKRVAYAVASYSPPHYYEWNLFNGIHSDPAYGAIATDLEGILCEEPPQGMSADSPVYLQFVRDAAPLQRPTRRPVSMIVCERPEKYRQETEEWLRRVGICYEKLLLKTIQQNDPESIAKWKANLYASSNCALFVESNPIQAPIIRRISKKPVLCPNEQPPELAMPKSPPYQAITKTNLICHLLPSTYSDNWRRFIEKLKARWHVFTNRKIIAVAQGMRCEHVDEVKRELDKQDAEWITFVNNPQLRSFNSFYKLLSAIYTTAPNEATFYCQHEDIVPDGLIEALLDRYQAAMVKLREYAAVGGCKMVKPPNEVKRFPSELAWPKWLFAGNAFWFRHDVVFSSPIWTPLVKDPFTPISWIGKVVEHHQAATIYQPWPVHAKDPAVGGKDELFIEGMERKSKILGIYAKRRWGRVLAFGTEDSTWLAAWCDNLVCIENDQAKAATVQQTLQRAGIDNVEIVVADQLRQLGKFDCVWATMMNNPRIAQEIARVATMCLGTTNTQDQQAFANMWKGVGMNCRFLDKEQFVAEKMKQPCGSIIRPAPQAKQKTIVVLGLPRSGTSMLMHVLRGLGVHIYHWWPENLPQEYEYLEQEQINFVLREHDLDTYKLLTSQQNEEHDVWAYKHIFGLDWLDQTIPTLRNPILVVPTRGIAAIVQRERTWSDCTWQELFEQHATMERQLIDFIGRCGLPTWVGSFDRMILKPDELVRELADFCGLSPSEEQLEAAKESVLYPG